MAPNRDDFIKAMAAMGSTRLPDLLRALATINHLHDLGDAIYAVRSREMEGWEGPKVTEYNNALNVVRPILEEWKRQNEQLTPEAKA